MQTFSAPVDSVMMKQRTTFGFYFGCILGEQLLRQTDNLGRPLQDSSASGAQGNRLTQDVVKTLLKDRTDSSSSIFGGRILQGESTGIQTIGILILS